MACSVLAHAQAVEALNMQLVGHHDLQGRSAYQPIVHVYNGRRILFVGQHAGSAINTLTGDEERNGVSILDVTNPSEPTLLHHLPPSGDADTGTQHVQVCSGGALPDADPDKTYLLRTNGQLSTEIFDVSDPTQPKFVVTVAETGQTEFGDRATHKTQWDCASGVGYLNLTPQGWRVPRILQAFDLSNPEDPQHIRDFGLDGWQPGSNAARPEEQVSGLHQPVVVGERMYLGYGSGGDGVLQILDRQKFLNGDPDVRDRFAPTTENLRYPQIARLDLPSFWGVHTAKPVYGMDISDYVESERSLRDFLIVVSEAGEFRCQEARDVMFLLDITEEDKPFPVSSFQVPEEPGDFCNRGGRFGPHSPQDAFLGDFDKRIVLLAYFNAGIRAVDIRNPFHPREVAHYIPQVTDKTIPSCITIDGNEQCDVAIQTNNLNIDERGYIYALDRAGTGVHILQLTGEAKAIAGL